MFIEVYVGVYKNMCAGVCIDVYRCVSDRNLRLMLARCCLHE
jgi:hypothetical protein